MPLADTEKDLLLVRMRSGYLAALLLLFAWSMTLSGPTLDRPLDLRHDWLTAHASINLQYMYECGPFQMLGASVLFLPSIELDCDFPRRLEDPGKRVYLSYPSGWLWAYLPLYALGRAVLPDSVPDYWIVRGLALLFIRLPLIALLLTWLRKSFMLFPGLTRTAALGPSILSSWVFISSPAFLYYTQNVVFTDMIVLPVIYASGLLLHRILESRGDARHFTVLGALLWLASSTDWYGALWSLFCLVALWFHRRPARMGFSGLIAVAAGPALAALHYLLQISLLSHGWDQVLNTAAERTGQNTASFMERIQLWSVSLSYWMVDLPMRLLPDNWILRLGLPAICISTALTMLATTKRRARAWLFLAPFLCGLLHLMALPEHSAEHDFSALKFGPFIVFTLALPLFLKRKLRNIVGKQSLVSLLPLPSFRSLQPLQPLASDVSAQNKEPFRTKPNTFRTGMRKPPAGVGPSDSARVSLFPSRVFLLLFALSIFAYPELRSLHEFTTGRPAPVIDHVSLELLLTFIRKEEVPVTLSPPRPDGYVPLQATGWDPPHGLALVGREVHTPQQLMQYSSAFREEALQAPVLLLAFRDHREFPCQWQSTGLVFSEGIARICRPDWSVRQYLESL